MLLCALVLWLGLNRELQVNGTLTRKMFTSTIGMMILPARIPSLLRRSAERHHRFGSLNYDVWCDEPMPRTACPTIAFDCCLTRIWETSTTLIMWPPKEARENLKIEQAAMQP